MSSYAEKLTRPEWRERRLEILEDRNHRCERCGARATQVHHPFYEWDREPWEYADDELEALCKADHDREHEARNVMFRLAWELGINTERIGGYLAGYALRDGVVDRIRVGGGEFLHGVGDVYGGLGGPWLAAALHGREFVTHSDLAQLQAEVGEMRENAALIEQVAHRLAGDFMRMA